MALTAWEGLKIVGQTVEKIGVDGETFEEENPGEKFVPSRGYIIDLVVETLTALGKEVID